MSRQRQSCINSEKSEGFLTQRVNSTGCGPRAEQWELKFQNRGRDKVTAIKKEKFQRIYSSILSKMEFPCQPCNNRVSPPTEIAPNDRWRGEVDASPKAFKPTFSWFFGGERKHTHTQKTNVSSWAHYPHLPTALKKNLTRKEWMDSPTERCRCGREESNATLKLSDSKSQRRFLF